MRLTDYTDYTLRVLMFCALHPERSVTIAELAESHKVSKNHLMKIVNDLARQGLLQTTRGRGGGLRLLKICFGRFKRGVFSIHRALANRAGFTQVLKTF